MKREKSCGALVYRVTETGQKELLFIKHRHGTHWSFPKGHMEAGENEVQTALREVKEETGLDIALEGDFRHSVEYYPKPNVKKQVVYFLGHANWGDKVVKQEEEIGETRWAPLEEAHNMVTFRNDKNLINKARKILMSEKKEGKIC